MISWRLGIPGGRVMCHPPAWVPPRWMRATPRGSQVLLLPFSLTKGADLGARPPVGTPAASALLDAAAPGRALWGLAGPGGERLRLKVGKALTAKPFFSEMISRRGGETLALAEPWLSSGAAAGGRQVTGGPLALSQGESS